jgi:Ca2+-binding RTX toxin-like protein
MKYAFVGVVLFALAGTAQASTTTFSGTSGVDTIIVGRGYTPGGALAYLACINGTWVYGSGVTGASDVVTVNGSSGADSITVRAVNDYYTCGSDAKWLYRMDYSYSCPGTLTLYGGTGNDRIVGGQCVERIEGEAGNDTIFGGGGDDAIYGGADSDCIADTTLSWLSCGDGTDSYTDDGTWKDCENHVSACFLSP